MGVFDSLKKYLATDQEKTKDPVCGMTVAKDENLKSTFEGDSYYFCSSRCKEEFDRNPANFVESE